MLGLVGGRINVQRSKRTRNPIFGRAPSVLRTPIPSHDQLASNRRGQSNMSLSRDFSPQGHQLHHEVSPVASESGSTTLNDDVSELSGGVPHQRIDRQVQPQWPLRNLAEVPRGHRAAPMPGESSHTATHPGATHVAHPLQLPFNSDGAQQQQQQRPVAHQQEIVQSGRQNDEQAYLSADSENHRPNSFEIMGCSSSGERRVLGELRRGRGLVWGDQAAAPNNSSRVGVGSGQHRTPTPYPGSPCSHVARNIRFHLSDRRDEVHGTNSYRSRALGTRGSQLQDEDRMPACRLAKLIIACMSFFGSLVSLTAVIGVLAIQSEDNQHARGGNVAWLVGSILIMVTSGTLMIFIFLGRDRLCPFSLQVTISRQRPQPARPAGLKEFELGDMRRQAPPVGDEELDRAIPEEAGQHDVPSHPPHSSSSAQAEGLGIISRAASTATRNVDNARPANRLSIATVPPTPPPKSKSRTLRRRSGLGSVGCDQVVMAGPSQSREVSSEQLLHAATSSSPMGHSNTETSILTELCDAVSVPSVPEAPHTYSPFGNDDSPVCGTASASRQPGPSMPSLSLFPKPPRGRGKGPGPAMWSEGLGTGAY